jgi:hypothetical protein
MAVVIDDLVLGRTEVGMQIREVVLAGLDVGPPPVILLGMTVVIEQEEMLDGVTRIVPEQT